VLWAGPGAVVRWQGPGGGAACWWPDRSAGGRPSFPCRADQPPDGAVDKPRRWSPSAVSLRGMFLVDALRGLLRPATCLSCGAPAAWPCCVRCLPSVPGAVGPWALAADPEVVVWALGPYRDALRTAVLAGKFDGQPAALTELGRRLGAALAAAGVGADLVTFVAAGRVAGPPRDHAERIAAGVATALDLPLVGLLAPAGGRDLGRARRVGRPDRAPPPRPPPKASHRLAGGRLLLVDDLATTGGTLAGAATTLRLAGARRVEAAVLAATPTALRPPQPLSAHPNRSPPTPPSLPPAHLTPHRLSPAPPHPRSPPHRAPCPSLTVRAPTRLVPIRLSRPALRRPASADPASADPASAPGPPPTTPPTHPRSADALAPKPAPAPGPDPYHGPPPLGPGGGGGLGRGVSRWRYDRDLPCSWRSHCVVVTPFGV
jgi:predicted amidophosphoribosyltransferase